MYAISCGAVLGATASEAWDEARQAQLIAQILGGELSLPAACSLHGLSAETIRSWVPVYRHRTLQALDEKLQQTSLIESVNAERLGHAAYTGSLDDIPVADLLQTSHMGGKNAVITITHGLEQSAIWCEWGVIVDAESGRLRGEAAVYRILSLESGHVSAEFRLEPRPRTIERPFHMLVLEAARHKDECARLIGELDGTSSIYLQAPGAWAADTTLTEREMLELCDGERSVADILATSDAADLDTLTAIASLVSRGYLLRNGNSASPPGVSSGPSANDWGKRSSMYLTLPQPAPSQPRRSAPWLVVLGLLLGSLIWLCVGTLYKGQAFGDLPSVWRALRPTFDRN